MNANSQHACMISASSTLDSETQRAPSPCAACPPSHLSHAFPAAGCRPPRRRARLDAPTPDAWAAAAVRQIGREGSFTPYWFHGLQQAFVRLAPTWLVNRQVGRAGLGRGAPRSACFGALAPWCRAAHPACMPTQLRGHPQQCWQGELVLCCAVLRCAHASSRGSPAGDGHPPGAALPLLSPRGTAAGRGVGCRRRRSRRGR